MNIFKGWDNHTERLKANWNRLVKPEDTVVLPGDLSWAMKLEDTKKDFEFLQSLNGKKIILKGNHDLWWTTYKKLNEFLELNNFNNIKIVFNNCVICEDHVIAGTRGWFFDGEENKKIILREAARLDASLVEAEKTGLPIIVFLHYPPAYSGMECKEIIDVLNCHNIKKVYYGHIHGAGFNNALKTYKGIELKLVSCDCVDFTPIFVV